MDTPLETALVVPIPEAEALVGPFRRLYDPSAARGIPAHVTILYPFKPTDELTPGLLTYLEAFFQELPSFETTFAQIMQFPDALFLAPEPADPFRLMTERLASRFPDTPPYRGAFKEIIPHLTVAQVSDPRQLSRIAADLQKAALAKLPFRASIRTVSLFESSSGLWLERARFPLHQDERSS